MLSSTGFFDWLAPNLKVATPRLTVRPGAKRLIIGQAIGCSPTDITPFVRSLSQVYGDDTVMLIDNDREMQAFLESYGVLPAPFSAGAASALARVRLYEYLLTSAAPQTSALLIEARGVVFQSDPFQGSPTRIELVEPGTEPGWGDPGEGWPAPRPRPRLPVQSLAAAQLKGSPIMGPAGALARLCRMALVLAELPQSASAAQAQVDMTLAVRLGLCDAEVRPNYSRLASISPSPSDRPRIRGGKIVNFDGTVSPIIQHYSRDPALRAFVEGRWLAAGDPTSSKGRPPRRDGALIR